ncbi:alpha/beta fold hydrolase [Roseomonas marmotae]|uniref:Alpha/beta hydrolase n=1 Tax=Roseomonas marmotae TaxID=2768161 RepID=A0ABS3K6Z4_9PROT|nr:alpha/beta hydrolase [Roseomonas marmotae]MBO1073226.1 alpha/beta hydrolase [Roseomonas marmotae]QTI79148.1 alpha/beta hydrolase [Roseomonas marmotae]
MLRSIDAGVLNVVFEEHGSPDGWPVLLMHGFPYDAHAYDAVAPILAAAGARVIVPWLRGYGPTRFLSPATPRSGEQAALGKDLLDLLDALRIRSAMLAGYDWGGRAACIVSALWPERVQGLVSQNGYNIQNIAQSGEPQAPENEMRLWYQYYFHSERGRRGLAENRREFCRLLWRLWSPKWRFDDATFERTAESFDNPAFVEVVIHSYRHRFGLVAGDPALLPVEHRLATQPPITVPAITLDGDADGVLALGGTAKHAPRFTGPHEHRVLRDGGHNLPQEMPEAFAAAILELRGRLAA